MRVLMFGWEFPPHIAGGLGTACYGMTKGLAYNDVDVLFVMPSASGDEDESAVKIINASDVAIDTVSATVDEFLGKVQFTIFPCEISGKPQQGQLHPCKIFY